MDIVFRPPTWGPEESNLCLRFFRAALYHLS